MESRIPITRRGFEALKAELHTLMSKERPAIQKAIAEARAHGDLRENAEYHAAKEKQSFIEGRIQEINGRMANLQVVEPSHGKAETITFGATVALAYVETDETLKYQIVGPDEADIKANRISYLSPIAKALIGKRSGDIVKVHVPKGDVEVEISSVKYE
jgi:transcription elongation factor GreA